jgi:hypothetical protein
MRSAGISEAKGRPTVNIRSVPIRRAVPATLALLALAAVAPPAYAAPAPFESYRATCDGYGDTRITEPGEGAFMPFFIEGTNQLVLPYLVHFSVVGGGTTLTGTVVKPAPAQADTIYCTFEFRFHVGTDLYVLTGDLTGVTRGEP